MINIYVCFKCQNFFEVFMAQKFSFWLKCWLKKKFNPEETLSTIQYQTQRKPWVQFNIKPRVQFNISVNKHQFLVGLPLWIHQIILSFRNPFLSFYIYLLIIWLYMFIFFMLLSNVRKQHKKIKINIKSKITSKR